MRLPTLFSLDKNDVYLYKKAQKGHLCQKEHVSSGKIIRSFYAQTGLSFLEHNQQERLHTCKKCRNHGAQDQL